MKTKEEIIRISTSLACLNQAMKEAGIPITCVYDCVKQETTLQGPKGDRPVICINDSIQTTFIDTLTGIISYGKELY